MLHEYTFKTMTDLSFLSLESNSLKVVHPLLFTHLSSIYQLVLSSNLMDSLVNYNFSEKKLSILNLKGCKVINVRHFYFSRIAKLVYLDLSENQISSIDYNFFDNLSNLHDLDLSNNFILRPDARVFRKNRKLFLINLESNLVLNVDVGTFQHLNALTRINLKANRIYSLSHVHFLNSSKFLVYLNLASNFLSSSDLHKFGSKNCSDLDVLLAGNMLSSFRPAK
jgi:hypothetical protein